MANFFVFGPASPSSSGGGVTSVNGQTGVVVLDADDVGAANQHLSNLLSPTAINQSLLPNIDDDIDCGDPTHRWSHVEAAGSFRGGGDFIAQFGARVLFRNSTDTTVTTFQASESQVDSSISYILPTTTPTTGQALVAGATPTELEWAAAGAGATAIVLSVRLTTTQVLSDAVDNAVLFNVEDINTDPGSYVSATGIWTANFTGQILVHAGFLVNGSPKPTGGNFVVSCYNGGSPVIASAGPGIPPGATSSVLGFQLNKAITITSGDTLVFNVQPQADSGNAGELPGAVFSAGDGMACYATITRVK